MQRVLLRTAWGESPCSGGLEEAPAGGVGGGGGGWGQRRRSQGVTVRCMEANGSPFLLSGHPFTPSPRDLFTRCPTSTHTYPLLADSSCFYNFCFYTETHKRSLIFLMIKEKIRSSLWMKESTQALTRHRFLMLIKHAGGCGTVSGDSELWAKRV